MDGDIEIASCLVWNGDASTSNRHRHQCADRRVAISTRNGFRLLELVGTGAFDIHLSVPLVLEYEEVLLRELPQLAISRQTVDRVIDYLCGVAILHQVFFLWRPYLADVDDDMILELAATARCDFVVTYNLRDFTGIERFGVQALEPAPFLQRIGKLS